MRLTISKKIFLALQTDKTWFDYQYWYNLSHANLYDIFIFNLKINNMYIL